MKYKCLICNNSKISSVITRPIGGRIIECATCGHYMLWPVLSDQEVLELYKNSNILSPQKVGSAIFDNVAFKLLLRSDKRKNLEVLDVGCGLGEFLDVATKYGHNACGIEITKSLVDELNNLGYKVFHKSLLEFSKYGIQFDWVSCLNVIEHVNNPLETFSMLANLVKPGGRLVLQTPNAKAISQYRNETYGLFIDKEHLNYYLPEQIVRIFNTYNFSKKIIKFYPTTNAFGRTRKKNKNYNINSVKVSFDPKAYRNNDVVSGARALIKNLPPSLRSYIRSVAQLIRYISSFDEIIKERSHDVVIVLEKGKR